MEGFNVPTIKQESTISAMLVSRQAQEVQAAMIVAKKFPRDEAHAYDRIMRSCSRQGLAEQAEYTYPRGGEKINGPSIRLAESIAQNWGNIDYGIIELENSKGQSDMMAYAWDLETNTRVTKVFSVKHRRDTKSGGYDLKDSRDIYEATANFGSRRVRACILGIIPGDVIEAAVNKCRETIKGAHKTPIEDRFKKMIAQFEQDFMVSQAMIEEYLGCNIKGINENDLIRMSGVFRSLRDGMSSPRDYFKIKDIPLEPIEIRDPFKGKDKAPAENGGSMSKEDPDKELKERLRKQFPSEEEWQIEARIKDIKGES